MSTRREVEGPPLAPSVPVHSFDRISKQARADPRLGDRAYRVLSALEAYSWGDSRECWVSNTTLAEQTGGGHPDSIRRALRLLEQAGYIAIIPDRTKARGQRIKLLYNLAGPKS